MRHSELVSESSELTWLALDPEQVQGDVNRTLRQPAFFMLKSTISFNLVYEKDPLRNSGDSGHIHRLYTLPNFHVQV